MQKRFAAFIMVILLGLLGASAPVCAQYEYKMDTKLPSAGQFESETSAKFSRGITNILFGWTEIMRTPVRISEDPRRGPFFSSLVGVPYGMIRFVGRTLVGAYEVVTFLAPQAPIFEPIEGTVL